MLSEDDLNQLHHAYQREFQSLNEQLHHFANDWPEAAHSLELERGRPSDPDMARLLDSLVWLCARLQVRLDDGYQSVSQQLLRLFYPDFLKPIPAMGVVKFNCSRLKAVSILDKRSTA